VGNYRAFFHAMEPLLVDGRPTRILDLAAGHGGFALEVARIAKRRGLEIQITASDLKREYLDIGAAVAVREGLDVGFEVQNALDLSNLGPDAYDIVVCTQSIHHFPPSMIARMFREACRAAGRGVVFIDGCRSMTLGVVVPLIGVLRFRDTGLAHDAFVSCRRFYSPEELGLLAKLGPEAPGVVAEWMRPAHCLLRFSR
jgi:ubiquinone/menaquinone biosynthesis C-methylase UbiE